MVKGDLRICLNINSDPLDRRIDPVQSGYVGISLKILFSTGQLDQKHCLHIFKGLAVPPTQ